MEGLSICNFDRPRTWWRVVAKYLQCKVGIKRRAGGCRGEEVA
jgi:hypothetical protein